VFNVGNVYNSCKSSTNAIKIVKNEGIRAAQVLLIDENGKRHENSTLREVLSRIDRKRFDLVLVNPSHDPPIAKLVPRASAFQKNRTLEHATTQQRLRCREKEVRFGTGMGTHDLQLRTAKVRELLERAYRVRVVVGVGSKATPQVKEAVQRMILERLRDEMGKDLIFVSAPEMQLGRLSVTLASATAKPPSTKNKADAVKEESEADGMNKDGN
jgi:translation initiation factor IF-3